MLLAVLFYYHISLHAHALSCAIAAAVTPRIVLRNFGKYILKDFEHTASPLCNVHATTYLFLAQHVQHRGAALSEIFTLLN